MKLEPIKDNVEERELLSTACEKEETIFIMTDNKVPESLLINKGYSTTEPSVATTYLVEDEENPVTEEDLQTLPTVDAPVSYLSSNILNFASGVILGGGQAIRGLSYIAGSIIQATSNIGSTLITTNPKLGLALAAGSICTIAGFKAGKSVANAVRYQESRKPKPFYTVKKFTDREGSIKYSYIGYTLQFDALYGILIPTGKHIIPNKGITLLNTLLSSIPIQGALNSHSVDFLNSMKSELNTYSSCRPIWGMWNWEIGGSKYKKNPLVLLQYHLTHLKSVSKEIARLNEELFVCKAYISSDSNISKINGLIKLFSNKFIWANGVLSSVYREVLSDFRSRKVRKNFDLSAYISDLLSCLFNLNNFALCFLMDYEKIHKGINKETQEVSISDSCVNYRGNINLNLDLRRLEYLRSYYEQIARNTYVLAKEVSDSYENIISLLEVHCLNFEWISVSVDPTNDTNLLKPSNLKDNFENTFINTKVDLSRSYLKLGMKYWFSDNGVFNQDLLITSI